MKRETIAYERILYYMGNTSLMHFAFRVKVNGNIGKNELEEALLKVQQRHPLARVRVEMTGDKKQFITTENVPEIPLYEFDGNEVDWKTVIKKELPKYFDIFKGPMIRAFLIQRENISDVVFIFHHAICDGLSAVVFLHDLFLFLENPITPVNPYKEAPIFTKLIKKDLLEMFKKKGLPDWLKDEVKVELKPSKVEPFPQPHFVIHNWFLTEDETKKIMSMAKEINVSVHGILGAVLLKSFAQEFGPKGGFRRVLQSPVNFKPFLVDEAKDYFGLFNGILTVDIDCSPEKTISEIAVDIYTKLKEKMGNYEPLEGYYFFNEYLLKSIEDPELFFANRPGIPMDYDFSLSNLGVIRMQKKYGRYEIEKVYGPIFSAIKGEKVIGVATHQGRMFFIFIYDGDCFGYDTGRGIVERALDMFKGITG
jgi:NRPS condensation-like uncharacterized protein